MDESRRDKTPDETPREDPREETPKRPEPLPDEALEAAAGGHRPIGPFTLA